MALTSNIAALYFNYNFSVKVCSELSADLANIVEEEHYILDNPITSPPTSFPTQLHRLDRLNLTAQTDIIQAKGALEEYFDTVLQMTCTMENNQSNIMERVSNLERSRYTAKHFCKYACFQ